MNKKQFEIILDQFAEHWFIGTERPMITGKRVGHYEVRTAEEGGFPQVLRFKKYPKYCSQCHTSNDTDRSIIDLKDRTVRYKCGCKLPIFNTSLNAINK